MWPVVMRKLPANYAIFDQTAPYLSGRAPAAGEKDVYEEPSLSGNGTLYEHCLRAIRRAARMGENGLPLMGTGDWNDGMDELGAKDAAKACGWAGSF